MSAAPMLSTAGPVARRGSAPTWSLRSLRLLVGHALAASPRAVEALLEAGLAAPGAPRCETLFRAIAAALACERTRSMLDGVLATLLAEEARRFAGRPLAELAVLGTQSRLAPHESLALLWLLGRHPSRAARRLEERIALALDARSAARPGGDPLGTSLA